MKCSKCGAELSENARFCSYCGQKIEIASPSVMKETEIPPIPHIENFKEQKTEETKADAPKSFAGMAKDKGIEAWNKLSRFGKVATVSFAVFVLLFLIALLEGNTAAVVIAIVQIEMTVVSILIHRGVIKLDQNKLRVKWLVLAVAILFAVLNIISYSWETKTSTTGQNPSSTPTGYTTTDSNDSMETQQPDTDPNNSMETQQPEQTELPITDTNNTLSVTKGTEYAYMTNEWNVYIATAISDNIIKVANWDKTMSSSKSVEYDYDVGTFKINDSENGFAWVDDEHTAFVLTFKDKNNSKFKKGGTATFTINISDRDTNKGSDYSKDIACFSYQNDDWHLYRAIPLTETLVKIETWRRGSSTETFLFGYDLCVIDTTSKDTDFEWTDDEHTSFSITMRDEENKYEWKTETFVVFILENEDYSYFDVKSYLGKWVVEDGEAAVPASSYDYKYENYQDVQKDLENAGFTNISTEILYDIVWGWTEEGEVKSVSIDGRTDYKKGEVFNMDTPIVITYHMKEEDDPNKSVNTESTKTESAETESTETGPAEIMLTMGADDFKGMNYQDAEKKFREMGFTKFEYETVDTAEESLNDTVFYTEITRWIFGDSDFAKGDEFDVGSTITFYIYKYTKPSPVSYSTNDLETSRKGDTGIFSYRSRGGSYYTYWIIDFDDGYVYWFTDGNGSAECDRIAIDSGTLNDAVTITYHDGNSSWSYRLFFKWKNQSDHLVMQDNDGFTYDYYSTNLSEALALKNTKTIYDY